MKKKLKSLLTTSLTFISLNAFAGIAAPNPEITTTMARAAESLSTLIPYAYDDDKFRAEDQKAIVQKHLNELNDLFAKKSELIGKQSDTAWISLKVLQNHLSETKELYSAGYFAMSQYLLTSTPAICSTCHIQDSAHSSVQSELSRENFANDYSYGEYLFTIRNYDKAKHYYIEHLKNEDVQTSRFQYLKPLERLLTIELGISQSIENARSLLDLHHKANRQIEIKQVIRDWVTGVEAIKSAGSKDANHLQSLFDEWFSNAPNNSHEFILDEEKRPQAIWLRAQLFDLLKSVKDESQTASTLYMLAILDRVLGQDEPYSFANLYLKQCVTQYPATESAKQCLEEYKNHLSFYYGGSAGEAVPEELVNEYVSMKNALEKAQK